MFVSEYNKWAKVIDFVLKVSLTCLIFSICVYLPADWFAKWYEKKYSTTLIADPTPVPSPELSPVPSIEKSPVPSPEPTVLPSPIPSPLPSPTFTVLKSETECANFHVTNKIGNEISLKLMFKCADSVLETSGFWFKAKENDVVFSKKIAGIAQKTINKYYDIKFDPCTVLIDNKSLTYFELYFKKVLADGTSKYFVFKVPSLATVYTCN